MWRGIRDGATRSSTTSDWDAASIERLGNLDVTLVWSPRSNLALYGATVDVPTALRAGARVAISTDWSYSGSYNLFEEFRCAEGVDRELWD